MGNNKIIIGWYYNTSVFSAIGLKSVYASQHYNVWYENIYL